MAVYTILFTPSFEEVLGMLELALARNECFRISGTPPIEWDQHRIQECRSHIVALICTILAEKLGATPGKGGTTHRLLASKLPRPGVNTSFITFNYDLLLDNALSYTGFTVDYGTTFANPIKINGPSVGIYKLHGSLNWLRCPNCGALTNTGDVKGASYPTKERQPCKTFQCGARTTPIVIPPTFFKVMSDYHLQQVWYSAQQKLAAADCVYFCGYSLPDADMHVRYLLKRAEVTAGRTPKVFVITNHGDKKDADREAERSRYLRLYRDPSTVVYTSWTFEQFANDPFTLVTRPRKEVEWVPPRARKASA
jgi:NAD-dependent SIR2 family protein deacetylase